MYFRPSVDSNKINAPDAENQSPHQESFPNQEFFKFKKQKAETFIFNNLLKSYAEKQITAFYNIWDNVEYMKLSGLINIEKKFYLKIFNLIKTNSIEKHKRRQTYVT